MESALQRGMAAGRLAVGQHRHEEAVALSCHQVSRNWSSDGTNSRPNICMQSSPAHSSKDLEPNGNLLLGFTDLN